MNPTQSQLLRDLQREQMRLRIRLASVLLGATCAFALMLAWLAQGDPLRPLLAIKTSLFGLLTVYAIAVGVAAIYARWIRTRRDSIVRASGAN
jgi:hypothetical protein